MCNEWEFELDRLRREEEMYQDYLFEEAIKQDEEDLIAEKLLNRRIEKQIKGEDNE